MRNSRSSLNLFRYVGKLFEQTGRALQDKECYVESLVPSTRIVSFKGKEPTTGLQNFVASTANLIGDVKLGEHASTWYGATIKGEFTLPALRLLFYLLTKPLITFFISTGDRASVTVGRGSAIMDNAVVETSQNGGSVTIGADVTVGAGAIVRSAIIGDGTMIGMGAQVHAGAKIGNDCYVDAGSIVQPGTAIPSGQLWTGSPARFLRALQPDEMSYMRTTALQISELGGRHFAQGSLSVTEVEHQQKERLLRLENSIADDAPLAVVDKDVVEYYKLTSPKQNSGLLRDDEINVAEELKMREAAELAADKEEEEFHANRARLRRVGEAVSLLTEIKTDHAEERDRVMKNLESRDPEGAGHLRALLIRAATGDKESLIQAVAATDFISHSEQERTAFVEAAVAALGAHAKASGVAALRS